MTLVKKGGLPRIRPPLRWAGSKRAQVSQLARHLPREYGAYIEPFAGSASLYFFLRPKVAVLGDVNGALIAFYEALAASPRRLHAHLSRLADDGDDYYEIRA